VALLVVLALGAGTVYAAIPNGSGTYYACLTKSSGVVRLINYPKVTCATGERFIKWSQQGPAGPAGVQGVQGPKGDQGPAGPADWNAIPNKPAGFSDGVDDGVTGMKLTTVSSSLNVASTKWISIGVDCPAGSKVTGGGLGDTSDLVDWTASYPIVNGTGWAVRAYNGDTTVKPITVFAVCMSVEPPGVITTAKKGMRPAKSQKHK